MKRKLGRLAAAALLLVSAACAAAGPSAHRSAPLPESRNSVGLQEIGSAYQSDAYAMVQTLRPLWLRQRGPSAIGTHGIQVYMDGVPFGGVQSLREIPGVWVASIEYLSAAEATRKLGTGHPDGALLIHTRNS